MEKYKGYILIVCVLLYGTGIVLSRYVSNYFLILSLPLIVLAIYYRIKNKK